VSCSPGLVDEFHLRVIKIDVTIQISIQTVKMASERAISPMFSASLFSSCRNYIVIVKNELKAEPNEKYQPRRGRTFEKPTEEE
jgi:hypothetical protein